MVLLENVICEGQFQEKKGYTLDYTMREESHMRVRQLQNGDLTLEDTMEQHHQKSVTTTF